MAFIPGKKKQLMEIDDLYDSISSFSFVKKILKEGLQITDISSTSTYKDANLKNNKYFILHHTAGRGTASDIVNILNDRKLGIQYIIDREGKVYKSTKGSKGAHVAYFYNSAPKDMNNSTAQGVEIIAKDDSDILIKQCKSALMLIKSLGYSLSNIYGHGEVSKNKMESEGKTCKAYVTKYWNTPESELPDTDTTLNTNVSDKKDDKSKDKKDDKSKDDKTQKNETFCKCLSDEKSKSSSWVFREAVKKCDPNTPIDSAIVLAKLCKTDNKSTTTTTTQSGTEPKKETWADKINFNLGDMFKGVTLEEKRIIKNVERIKKIL